MESNSTSRWSNRVAFVTGGNRGIGEAVVRRLVSIGVNVVAFDKRIGQLQVIANEVKGKQGKIYPIQGDVRNEEDVISAFRWVEDNLGPVHILVNNAGIVAADSLTDGRTEGWRLVMDTNVMGLSMCTREAVKSMERHGFNEGHIFNINSICPGMVQTRLLASVPLPEGVFEKTLTPDDIAETLLFILSLRQSVHIPEVVIVPRVQVNRTQVESRLKAAK